MIPRILHQIWLQGPPLPPELVALQRFTQTVAIEAGWEYRLWSMFDTLTPHHLSAAARDVFRTLAPKCGYVSAQGNVLRLFVLAEYGGLYLDTDVILRALPEGLSGAWLPRNLKANVPQSNFAIAAEVGHPFIRRAIAGLAECNPRVHMDMGPLLMGRCLGPDVNLWPVEAWHDLPRWPAGFDLVKGTYGHHCALGLSMGHFHAPPLPLPEP